MCVLLLACWVLAFPNAADAQLFPSLEEAKASADASFTAQAAFSLSALMGTKGQALTVAQGLREELLASFERNTEFPESASKETRESVSGAMREVLKSVSLDKLQRIADCMKRVIVVPRVISPTALAPFAGLTADKREELDREWRHLNGCAYNFPDGSFMVLLKEKYDGWVSEGVVIHEWGHIVHLCGLTESQKELVENAYKEQTTKEYSYSNGPFEYFAQNTALWFENGSLWVKDDVKMHTLLEAIYGQPREQTNFE